MWYPIQQKDLSPLVRSLLSTDSSKGNTDLNQAFTELANAKPSTREIAEFEAFMNSKTKLQLWLEKATPEPRLMQVPEYRNIRNFVLNEVGMVITAEKDVAFDALNLIFPAGRSGESSERDFFLYVHDLGHGLLGDPVPFNRGPDRSLLRDASGQLEMWTKDEYIAASLEFESFAYWFSNIFVPKLFGVNEYESIMGNVSGPMSKFSLAGSFGGDAMEWWRKYPNNFDESGMAKILSLIKLHEWPDCLDERESLFFPETKEGAQKVMHFGRVDIETTSKRYDTWKQYPLLAEVAAKFCDRACFDRRPPDVSLEAHWYLPKLVKRFLEGVNYQHPEVRIRQELSRFRLIDIRSRAYAAVFKQPADSLHLPEEIDGLLCLDKKVKHLLAHCYANDRTRANLAAYRLVAGLDRDPRAIVWGRDSSGPGRFGYSFGMDTGPDAPVTVDVKDDKSLIVDLDSGLQRDEFTRTWLEQNIWKFRGKEIVSIKGVTVTPKLIVGICKLDQLKALTLSGKFNSNINREREYAQLPESIQKLKLVGEATNILTHLVEGYHWGMPRPPPDAPGQIKSEFSIADLSLNDSELDHKEFACIGRICMKRLDLSGADFPPEALKTIISRDSLMTLRLVGVKLLKDSYLHWLAMIPNLTYLELKDNPLLLGKNLWCLAEVQTLRRLGLANTGISDETLPALIFASKLEELDLRFTSITDRAVLVLAQLPSIRKLQLGGTQMTLKAIRELRRILPECEITVDSKGLEEDSAEILDDSLEDDL